MGGAGRFCEDFSFYQTRVGLDTFLQELKVFLHSIGLNDVGFNLTNSFCAWRVLAWWRFLSHSQV